jgi:hypothetical protein
MPSFSVGQASQHIVFTTDDKGATYNGAPYTVQATAPGGAVTFSADPAGTACNVSSSGIVTFIAAGDCFIDANQAGDTDYSPAAMVQQPISVAQASQTITSMSSPPCGQSLINACATQVPYPLSGASSSGLQVTFGIDPSSTPGSCSLGADGITVTINGGMSFPGNCVIDWIQGGDQNYAPAGTQTQTIIVI